MKAQYDFLVIGSGLAGLSFALKASELGSVAVVSKTKLETGNTEMAQGGIAAVTTKEDSVESHIQDTLNAGAGLCHPDVVRQVVEQGYERVKDLVNWGVEFDHEEDPKLFSLHQEGGHSQRRILHIEDHTGLDIQKALLKTAQESPRIHFLSNHLAIDLIMLKEIEPQHFGSDRCLGAYFLNRENSGVSAITARNTVLACGGAGKSYLYTSNWSGATGDGVAMAYRAGARVSNLEFMQFHPTCLFHPHSRNFLISEALRGEGGELINSKGAAFTKEHDPRGALAPRDIVARAIDAEMKRSGADCVYLDMTHKPESFLKTKFPQIYKRALQLGINMATEPLPVVPAAHYLCGGVLTDIHGKTDIQGLFALGETACTGVHGANRLASNSLLECLAFSHNAFEWLKSNRDTHNYDELPQIPDYPLQGRSDPDEVILISHAWEEIRRLMWAYVGIVRTNRRLHRAHSRIQNILSEIKDYESQFRVHSDVIESRNIAIFADLTVRCALTRKESRGIHFNTDFPSTEYSGKPKDTVIDPSRDY